MRLGKKVGMKERNRKRAGGKRLQPGYMPHVGDILGFSRTKTVQFGWT